MGNHFLGPLPADGEYTVQVYLMRNAARRKEVANYRLSLNLSPADGQQPSRLTRCSNCRAFAFM